jgi:hypothetical protein
MELSREMAKAEFEKWAYTHKKLKPRLVETEDNKPAVDGIIENFMDGTFTMDDKGNITHKLQFPENINNRETLVYKPRLQSAETDRMKDLKSPVAKTRAVLAAMAGESTALLDKMDSSDVSAGGMLVSFYFLA